MINYIGPLVDFLWPITILEKMWLKKKSSSVQSLHTWSKLAGFLESSEPYMHRKIQSLREQTWPWTAHVILKGFVKCNFLYYRTSKAFCSLQEIKYFEGKKDNSGNIFAFLGKKWKDEDVLTTKAPTLDMTDVNVDGAQDVLRHIRRRRKDIYQKPSGWQSGTLKDLTTSLVNGNQPWPSTWTHGCLGCSNLKKLESNAFPGRLPTALPAPRGRHRSAFPVCPTSLCSPGINPRYRGIDEQAENSPRCYNGGCAPRWIELLMIMHRLCRVVEFITKDNFLHENTLMEKNGYIKEKQDE